MMKFCVQQWDKNKDRMKEDIKKNVSFYNEADYKDILKKTVELILLDEDCDYDNTLNPKKITEIDNGDYQGTLLYMIPFDTYQPSENEYLMTYVGYGSCSGCDFLQSFQMWGYDPEDKDGNDPEKIETFVKDVMTLAKDFLQNMIKPYNSGWRNEDQFNHI